MNDIMKDYVDSIRTEVQHKEAERLLRNLFSEGLDIDVLRKTFSHFLSHEEIERIIEDEGSKINEKPLCTREEALRLAIRKINRGCCLQYVSSGLKEWLGIEISPNELDTEISTHPDLLPSNQRLRNAWYNIRHVEPDNTTRFQIQQKYGFDCAYQDLIFESDRDTGEHQQYAVGDIQLDGITPTAEFQEYAEKERRGKLTPEDKQKFLQKPYTTEEPSASEVHALSRKFIEQNEEVYKTLASRKERPE